MILTHWLQRDPLMADAVRCLSHERAILNLSAMALNPETWAKLAMHNLEHISHGERNIAARGRAGRRDGHSAGQYSGILYPVCLVIGASFHRLWQPVAYPYAWHVPGWYSRGCGECCNAYQGRVQTQNDLLPYGLPCSLQV